MAHCPQPSVINLEEDNQPLPTPFNFPNFPRKVEEGLKSGSVTVELYREVAKYTAHAMYAYSRVVTKQERERVARELVEKYSKLKSSNAQCPYVSLNIKPIAQYICNNII